MSERFDYCIIGAGIVGLATARALIRRFPRARILLLEKEDRIGLHQTGRNSGVIHSGIYYKPGSLKARLCREGERRTKAFCHDHGIPFEARGKLIVATSAQEEERLTALAARAGENGIAVEQLDSAGIVQREPAITGTAALFVPAAAIVDYREVIRRMAAEFTEAGGVLRLGSAPDRIEETAAEVRIGVGDARFSADRLVACAGLQSDRIARLAGLDAGFRIVPFRGEYWQLDARKADIAHAMIYPVPDPTLPFLGIHLTPTIDGRMTVGPNAVLGFAREGYAKGSFSLRDTLTSAAFPGFWKVVAANLGHGIGEMANSISKSRYLRACRKYCPSLELADLRPMACGIRAQAVMRDGTLAQDFLFEATERMLHVCNAPSPAATSAMPIADIIVERLVDGRAANETEPDARA